jgi:signal transduction histidine kinase
VTQDIWNSRLRTTVIGVEWIALALAILVTIAQTPEDPLVFVAAGLGAIWVIGTTSLPLEVANRPFVLDAAALLGVALTMTSLVLTGGVESPYLLLSLTPSIYAGMFGGIRLGLAVGTLTALLAAAIPLAGDGSIVDALPLAVLAVALGVAVAQIRRIFLELDSRVTAAEASTDASSVRLQHLESANQLLARLAEITSRDEVNPIAVGRTALEAITSRFPGSAGSAALESDNGPILVSKYGTIPDPFFDTDIPLFVSDKRVGFIRLSTPEPLDEDTVRGLHEALRPVSLAFANALLLQDVTKNAVREERTRLARELHDEIGPSLASLGLSLDMALIQGVDQRELNDHLGTLRDRVAGLVDEVRSTVTDLRAGSTGSLITRVEQLRSALTTSMKIAIEVDERRPVRPSLSDNVYGIIGEAVRNAVNHSGGESVSVKGWVDFDRGRVVISDDGIGFDPAEDREGHFGLVGMQERAKASGIRLDVTSASSGTNVTIEWGTT